MEVAASKRDNSGISPHSLIAVVVVVVVVVLLSVAWLVDPTLAISSSTVLGVERWRHVSSLEWNGWSTQTTTTHRRHKRPGCTIERLR